MGQSVAGMRDSTEKAAVKEQLDFLVKVANFKLDKFQSEIERGFTDPEYTLKRQVPGKRALRWARGYRVGVTESEGLLITTKAGAEGAEAMTNDPVKDIISSFLGLHNPEPDEVQAMASLQKNVLEGFKFIFSSQNVGEIEDQRFFVFMLNNAIIRIDACLWKYNFSSTEVMASAQDVLCYTLCLSVVDHSKLTTDEMVFLVSEYTGVPKNTIDYTNSVSSLWHSVNRLANTLSTNEERERQAGIGYGGPPRMIGAPAAMNPRVTSYPLADQRSLPFGFN